MASPKPSDEKAAETDDTLQPSPDVLLTVPHAEPIAVLMGRIVADLPAIGKNSEMSQGAKFKYRGIEDVLNALNPLLSKYGVFVVPHEVTFLSETIRTTKGGGVMQATRLKVAYRWYGPMGDFIPAGGTGEGADSGDKGTQKAMTSAFKYMLFETLCISTEEGNASDVDRSVSDERVLTPQEERKQAFEASGDTVPNGWESFEEFDEAHQTVQIGLKKASDEFRTAVKERRAAAGLPWPMTKDQMDEFLTIVLELRAASDEFEAVAPESGGDDAPVT